MLPANKGIGRAAAEEFAALKARVILACRDKARGDEAAEAIKQSVSERTGGKVQANVSCLALDLASFASVVDFCKQVKKSKLPPINILVNNAGVVGPKQTTVDGNDMMVQSNHLGHFLLTNLLWTNNLLTPQARVVNVSSAVHVMGSFRFEALNYPPEQYMRFAVYNDTKLMNIAFSCELNRRFARMGSDRRSIALHPVGLGGDFCFAIRDRKRAHHPMQGNVDSDFVHHFLPRVPAFIQSLVRSFLSFVGITITTRESAHTILYASVDKEMAFVGGIYNHLTVPKRLSDMAREPTNHLRLWAKSEQIVGKYLSTQI